MASKIVTIKKNPKLDWAIALLGGPAIPTKQDKFKPLIGMQGILQDGDSEQIFDNLYIKKPDKPAIEAFEKKLSSFLKENVDKEMPYKMPVEVILNFDINRKRLFEVDVDNLSKTILDSMKGVVFEDDNQVVRLLAIKDTHPLNINGLMIAVNKVEKPEQGWFANIKLFYIEEAAEVAEAEIDKDKMKTK
ncbi:RusA family crossover junction endodeoxyribonuclease [Mucilaginibacter sp. BT774]|uniref:RusA family crossover junction endodeoxyribonuclease n=1 Tax=Mucilaginibacter sp. BT774 TaxID=3062276 RepID=UPI0026745821|nr:RusA family crossover junction endodeoxyribonuclease [Mucilaginibacter sp. BT774]MDO3627605.1 RusA family crossover junction endodeoxyribonuclease [Mucilaginibacter sp. BT774]